PRRTATPARPFVAHVANRTRRAVHITRSIAHVRGIEGALARSRRYEVVPALSPEFATALMRGIDPDVVVVDLAGGDVDGNLSMVQALRADALFAEVPIVVIARNAWPADIDRLRSAGCTA